MTTNYEDLRKKASVKSAMPEGRGRSVVGDREIITKPTQAAEVNPMATAPPVHGMDSINLPPIDIDDRDSADALASIGDDDVDFPDIEETYSDRSRESEEQTKGIHRINGFKEKDLAHQYRSLMKQYGNNPLGQRAINEIITEEDDGTDEGLIFLKESIKYGRGQ